MNEEKRVKVTFRAPLTNLNALLGKAHELGVVIERQGSFTDPNAAPRRGNPNPTFGRSQQQ